MQSSTVQLIPAVRDVESRSGRPRILRRPSSLGLPGRVRVSRQRQECDDREGRDERRARRRRDLRARRPAGGLSLVCPLPRPGGGLRIQWDAPDPQRRRRLRSHAHALLLLLSRPRHRLLRLPSRTREAVARLDSGALPKGLVPQQVNVVPRGAGAGAGDDRGHYSVVFPIQRLDPSLQLEIFVFSSETRAWSSRVAKFLWDAETTCDAVVLHTSTKAVAAGGGSLAWVDLWRGVLLCEWLDDGQPVLRLIQWPVLPPRGVPIDIASPAAQRDATMSDGVITFVDLQFRYEGGSGYFALSNDATGDHGWAATVWKRKTSSVHWGISLKANTNSIFAADSRSSSGLLRKMRDDGGVNELADLKKLVSATPRVELARRGCRVHRGQQRFQIVAACC